MSVLRCTDAEAFFACRSRRIESKIAPPVSGPQRPAVCLSSDGQTGGVVMSKRIPLTQGKFAIVDDTDFDWLNQWKWYTHADLITYYATRWVYKPKPRRRVFMHRLILSPPKDMMTDHINGNGLDNRRCNLRVCTSSQNQQNSRKHRGCSSIYKGVSRNTGRGKTWVAYICTNGRLRQLGAFDDEWDAACAYNAEARKHFGVFAKPNVLQRGEE